MKLAELLACVDLEIKTKINDEVEVDVTGIVQDSREVLPGNIYVALKGDTYDGHNYIRDAISKGALAVVGERELINQECPYIKVDDSRKTLAYLSAAFNDFPGNKLTVLGVTGTDGKTTTVNLIYEILTVCGIRAGMISTVNAVIGDERIDTGFHVTTPESPKIQTLLRKMVERGLTHVVIEATSHGLEQHRVTACDFDIGIITNITHEHLDYHGNYDQYVQAKAALLTSLEITKAKSQGNYRTAILNKDDTSYKLLHKILKQGKYQSIEVITYGVNEKADIMSREIHNLDNGLEFTLKINGKDYKIQTPLIGEYNVYNIMAAVSATAIILGLDMGCIMKGISKLSGVPGRMEKIDMGQEFTTIVDFAHTPNALKAALETSRNRTKGRVISVFGSAGLRDRDKRRLMAETSVRMADISILTAEDPRTESLDAILAEMKDEAIKHGGIENSTVFCIPDRGKAIKKSVELAEKDDLVIICGKGHEQSMCFGDEEYPWDDRIALRAAMASILKIAGPDMPYLPTQNR
jgi:UDP-N-acetylmuramoyl-L-alanyl-D-glutamate--2,6-diaminopimelate ligase